MKYFPAMQSVLALDESIYGRIMVHEASIRYSTINVGIFGLIHAVSSLLFSRTLLSGEGLPYTPDGATQAFMVLMGIAVAFLLHGGAGLFFWAFARGVGGRTAFLPVYFNLGIAFIGLWPLAPILAALQVQWGSPLLYGATLLASGYGLLVIFGAVKNAAGLSLLRMALAMLLTISYIGCFLYLWL